MTDRTPQFDAAREAYEAARTRLLGLIDNHAKDVPVSEYRAMLKQALEGQQRAHKVMMEAWG